MEQTSDRQIYKTLLPERTQRSNKGTYGTLLLGAGSCGMAGAALLSATAAYRVGTGIVAVLSDECNRGILQLGIPEALFQAYRHPAVLDDGFSGLAVRASAIAIGPGIGQTKVSEAVAGKLLSMVYSRSLAASCQAAQEGRGRPVPLLLDADALNLLSQKRLAIPESALLSGTIITPHPGEMSRLTGLPVREILADPKHIAEEYASRNRLICVLKDHRTVVTDGHSTFINPTGCDGMATGGSGDVLTGMIGGLLAQGCPPLSAARLCVYLHGRAGELAQAELGARSMIARDIIAHIPQAILETEDQAGEPEQAGEVK